MAYVPGSICVKSLLIRYSRAVSYTHLDVYKRQFLSCSTKSFRQSTFSGSHVAYFPIWPMVWASLAPMVLSPNSRQ